MSLSVPDLPFLTADQEEQLEEALDALGPRVQEAFKADWDKFGPEVQRQAQRAAKYGGRLALRRARGEDVTYGQRQLQATLGSLAYAGVREATTTILTVIKAWWEDVLQPLLEVLAQEAVKAVGRAAVEWVGEAL